MRIKDLDMVLWKDFEILFKAQTILEKIFSILTRHLSLFKVILTMLKREHADNLWSKCLQTTHSIGQTYIPCQTYCEEWKEKTTLQKCIVIHVSFPLCWICHWRNTKNHIFSLNKKITIRILTKNIGHFNPFQKKRKLLFEAIFISVTNHTTSF